ncbi:NAD-dependent 4,6-dehydratase LegB [Prochlorococcus marinus]|uniref:Nucleoside-diphosphate-sugar epimerase n=1 Tax=Prochlorococcus marinus (strain MIT 9211) TaxID=93059 RepID=A9BBF9_PROM4|nr:NAD-dependent 4,6-dehydratase LegB [Prochlorococcus marinus]ABX09171.1 Nucleoside-diphosphate-sugar epimerase [Prochlorococcus marinus str. MIT 9211]
MTRKVLVTGADGFIGSHLVESLLDNGYEVKPFCFYNSSGSWGWLEELCDEKSKELDVFLGDIRDPVCVKEAMKGCDMVFHLAALIGIPYSYIAARSYIETNIIGTLNVLEAAKDLGVSKIIHTSTSETYGTAQSVPINEKHPLSGQSPYSASKIGADQIALSFWHSFNIPVTVIRPFNTFGPRQSNRAVIPTIISQIASGAKKIELGSLSPTRDFTYVLDTCSAYIAIANSNKVTGKVINAASNFEISIGDTASLIASLMQSKVDLCTDSKRIRPINSEVNRLYGDNSLIKDLTDWQPKFSGKNGFNNGLKKTIEWFQKPYNLSKYKHNIYSI